MASSEPGRSSRWKHTIDVLSWPVGAGMPWPTITKRVWFSGWSSISRGEDLEAVDVAPRPVADRRHARCASTSPPRGRPRRWSWRAPRVASGRLLRQHIRVWPSGFGCDTTVRDVGELRAGLDAEVERDRQVDLALDEQLGVEGERVERDRDRALDRVLDGHDADVDLAVLDRGDHVGNGPLGRRSPAARSGWVSSASSANVPEGPKNAIDRIVRSYSALLSALVGIAPIVVTSVASACGASVSS